MESTRQKSDRLVGIVQTWIERTAGLSIALMLAAVPLTEWLSWPFARAQTLGYAAAAAPFVIGTIVFVLKYGPEMDALEVSEDD